MWAFPWAGVDGKCSRQRQLRSAVRARGIATDRAVELVGFKREGPYKFHYLDSTPLRQITERWAIRD